MYRLILFALMIISPFASTGTLKYEIKMDVFRNGEKVASPKILTVIGEKATVVQEDQNTKNRIDVIAEEVSLNGESMIHLKMNIALNDKDGRRSMVTSPEILTRENETAEISVGNSESDEYLKLNVVAVRRL